MSSIGNVPLCTFSLKAGVVQAVEGSDENLESVNEAEQDEQWPQPRVCQVSGSITSSGIQTESHALYGSYRRYIV